MTDGSRVLVAVRVASDCDRAFEAFTAEIGQWWRPNSLFRFGAGAEAATMVFEPGPDGRSGDKVDLRHAPAGGMLGEQPAQCMFHRVSLDADGQIIRVRRTC